ncbi:hypothetical protein [Leptospira harrisiae]|uniref:hypothetical protein n=1 Tax=Leptospira harrisiae TaxID=2023189 RepID=UPI000C2B439F|nr:hypothetical protein [Leptospira harrisiae]PKA06417.1 hypothetical protein CH366_19220 [Leptospira harrisiae]
MRIHTQSISRIINDNLFIQKIGTVKGKYKGDYQGISIEEFNQCLDNVLETTNKILNEGIIDKIPFNISNSIFSQFNALITQFRQPAENIHQIVAQILAIDGLYFQFNLYKIDYIMFQDISTQLITFQNNANNEISNLTKIINDQEIALKTKIETLDSREKSLDKLITEKSGELINLIETRRAKLDESLLNFKNEFELIRSDIKEENNSFKVTETKKIKDLLKEATDDANSIKSLAGDKAGDSIASGFQENANNEKFSKQVWQGVFLFSISLIILFSYQIFFPDIKDENQNLNYYKLLGRFLLSIPLGIIATFAAKYAKNHEIYEKRYRQKELDLRAINPFISRLEKDKRDQIISELTKSLFNKDDSNFELEKFKENISIVDELLKIVNNVNWNKISDPNLIKPNSKD